LLKFTEDHEWLKLDKDVATVGITEHAVTELGDLVFIQLPEVGATLAKESDGELRRNISIFRKADHGMWRRSYEDHRLRLWPAAAVLEELRASGFVADELPGYTGTTMPPSLHAYLARKPE
jgi:hypothetical protein